MVRLYTRQGDGGCTTLFDGSHHGKSEKVFVLLSQIDLIISEIGMIMADEREGTAWEQLQDVANTLFTFNAYLATPQPHTVKQRKCMCFIPEIITLEQWIDAMFKECPVNCFVLPQHRAHIVRVYVRDAERTFWEMVDEGLSTHQNPMQTKWGAYLNRLSSYFFALGISKQQERQPLILKT